MMMIIRVGTIITTTTTTSTNNSNKTIIKVMAGMVVVLTAWKLNFWKIVAIEFNENKNVIFNIPKYGSAIDRNISMRKAG